MYSPDFDSDRTPSNAAQKAAELIFLASILHVFVAVLLRNLAVDSSNETTFYNLICIQAMFYYLLDCASALSTLVVLSKESPAEGADQFANAKLMSAGALLINTVGASTTAVQLLS